MGYRSDVTFAFYPRETVRGWLEQHWPQDWCHVEETEDMVLVSYRDVKWYDDYTFVREALAAARALMVRTLAFGNLHLSEITATTDAEGRIALAVTVSGAAPGCTTIGWATTRSTRSTADRASSTVPARSSSTDSSPPRRAAASDHTLPRTRSALRRRLASSARNRSPASWPWRSLMALK